MTQFLTVKNWEKFQHYKDRNPPWIKLHFEIMTSTDWVMLADASKLLAVVCMMIASRNNGQVPNNPEYIRRVAYLDKVPNLTPLIECGFLINPLADASSLQADARPETEAYSTETDTERKEKINKKKFETEFQEIWEEFPKQRKGNREKAEAAYRQALTRSPHAEILAGLKSYVDSDEVKQGFAKGMAAWLNDDRWKTDYAAVASSAGDTPSQLIEADPLLKNYLAYAKSGREIQPQAEEYLIIKLGPNWRKYVG